MKKLKVTNRFSLTGISYASIDDKDYERLSQYTWGVVGLPNKLRIVRKKWNGRNKKPVMTQIHLSKEIIECPKGMVVDHIDGNVFNNLSKNLRVCTISENNRNRVKNTKKCSSVYKGVHWFKRVKLWQGYINYQNKRINLGYFKNEKQAAHAYNLKAKELFGDFALLNKV